MVGSEKSRFVSSGDCWAKFTVSVHLFMGIGRECTLVVTRDVVGGSCAAADFTVAQAGTLYRIRHAHVFAKRPQNGARE